MYCIACKSYDIQLLENGPNGMHIKCCRCGHTWQSDWDYDLIDNLKQSISDLEWDIEELEGEIDDLKWNS